MLLFIIKVPFSSDVSICPTMAFPPLQNSDHVVVSVSIDFPLNSQGEALFHCIANDYCRADWDTPWEHILNSALLLLLVNFVRLKLINISLILSMSSSLTHLHGFQLLVLLP